MDFLRDLVDSIGLKPEHFNYFIILDIMIGGIWAVRRLYRDLTGPDRDIYGKDYLSQTMDEFDHV